MTDLYDFYFVLRNDEAKKFIIYNKIITDQLINYGVISNIKEYYSVTELAEFKNNDTYNLYNVKIPKHSLHEFYKKYDTILIRLYGKISGDLTCVVFYQNKENLIRYITYSYNSQDSSNMFNTYYFILPNNLIDKYLKPSNVIRNKYYMHYKQLGAILDHPVLKIRENNDVTLFKVSYNKMEFDDKEFVQKIYSNNLNSFECFLFFKDEHHYDYLFKKETKIVHNYIYYFVLNKEQTEKYVINDATYSGKHVRVNIGEGVKSYNINVISHLNNNYTLYRINFTSDEYRPDLDNAQITKTFYSLQKDLNGIKYNEDIKLNKDLNFINKKSFEIKAEDDINDCIECLSDYYNTYYFILSNEEIDNYLSPAAEKYKYYIHYLTNTKPMTNWPVYKLKEYESMTLFKVNFHKSEFVRDNFILKIYPNNNDSLLSFIFIFPYKDKSKYDYLNYLTEKETNYMINDNDIMKKFLFDYTDKNHTYKKHYTEFKNTIKEVKFNGPATIVFWNDGSKSVVKCNNIDEYNPKKGLAMAISKKVKNWEACVIKDIRISRDDSAFEVIWKTGTPAIIKFEDHTCDFEYCLALARVKKYFSTLSKDNSKWYKKFESYLPKETNTFSKPQYNEKEWDEWKEDLRKDFKIKSRKDELPAKDELIKTAADKEKLIAKITELFNKGCSVRKIGKALNISDYLVKKYLDNETSPEGKVKNRKPQKERHVYKTIEYPKWLPKEDCDRILKDIKTNKYYRCNAELQKLFIKACIIEKIFQCYGNGYSMYEIANIVGLDVKEIERLYNHHYKRFKLKKGNDE